MKDEMGVLRLVDCTDKIGISPNNFKEKNESISIIVFNSISRLWKH